LSGSALPSTTTPRGPSAERGDPWAWSEELASGAAAVIVL
jgi:hypothetical protein